jgi:5'-deoxynucleotidase YfbR-like HD superfamily hydrolase
MLVADWVHNHTSIEINVEEVMRRGVLHDVEEVVTGDFPRPFKHGSGPEFAVAVEAASSKVCVDVMRSFTFDNDQAWYYHSIWERAKDDSYEGRVFAFADFLSAISFIVQEIESGNRMQSHIGTIQNYVQIFRSPEYEFIESLVRQVEGLLREVLV